MTSSSHRGDALPVLQRMGADATEALLGLLVSADRIDDRRAYFGALRQMTEGTALLANMLTHDEWFVVRNVADLCGELRVESAVARLARHVTHPDERVRRSVALALARIGTPGTVEPLRQALRDESPTVRMQLLQALDGKRNRALAMSIAVALDHENHPDVQREMLLALGRIGSPESVQVLMRAAEPGGRVFNRKPVPGRRAAVEGLDLRDGKLRATLTGNQLTVDEFTLHGGPGSTVRIPGQSGNLSTRASQAASDGGRLSVRGSARWGDAAQAGNGSDMVLGDAGNNRCHDEQQEARYQRHLRRRRDWRRRRKRHQASHEREEREQGSKPHQASGQ